MSPGWRLCSLLLLLEGSLALLVEIPQDSINGTVGQSVLLPVSYSFDSVSDFTIRWSFINFSGTVITCKVWNCFLGAGGAPNNCSNTCFTHPSSRGRVQLFPQNGSLLLRDLQLRDSGLYLVTFLPWSWTWNITLAVHEQRVTPARPGATEQDHIHYSTIGICSSVPLLLLVLLFCCLRRWGSARRQKRKITEQQQVSRGEELHRESVVVRDMTTVYARVGDKFEQPQQRRAPVVMCASATAPGPPRTDKGLYCLRV